MTEFDSIHTMYIVKDNLLLPSEMLYYNVIWVEMLFSTLPLSVLSHPLPEQNARDWGIEFLDV